MIEAKAPSLSSPNSSNQKKLQPPPPPAEPKLTDSFLERHIGPNKTEVAEMLQVLGYTSLDELINAAVPKKIRLKQPLKLPPPQTEFQAATTLRSMMSQNKVFKSYIGMGYHDCLTPTVIQRNILENPGWYTAYTPYQPEIAQGRLEALLNFQTMVIDLTGMEIANASLLDEATAAAEAMHLCHQMAEQSEKKSFFISEKCHPQTIDVVQTRALPLGIKVVVGDHREFKLDATFFGVLLQYPATEGQVYDYEPFIEQAHHEGALAVVAADIMSLALLRPPGKFGADVVVGTTQRFGVPLGFGGPHAAYFATLDRFKRLMPGRLVGVSKDAQGKPALRLSLQTREQHIRREKATSNICTAQVLLAVMASMYALYHGPHGIRRIAERIHLFTKALAEGLKRLDCEIGSQPFFDTIQVRLKNKSADELLEFASDRGMNLRKINEQTVGISLNETVQEDDLDDLLAIFNEGLPPHFQVGELFSTCEKKSILPQNFQREGEILTHPIFRRYHTETEMLRYMRRLESRDLSLTTSMIPLGSCTMKLNASSEMFPVSWPEVGSIHPFAPANQTRGYQQLFVQLEDKLAEITGFAGISLQPNSGSAGEYAGLLAIHDYLQQQGEGNRRICLIPVSAHGTNPASAAMAGFEVVPVSCDSKGNIDLTDLRAKAEAHRDDLACIMITYPSTHGVFEETIIEINEIIHKNGGQVYMDGANMTAQVGLCRPADYGVDVCHLNLHKTFCIPHGGGGPGVGPIGVAPHLVPFLPGHAVTSPNRRTSHAVSAAPWGSASILVISWMYMTMLGTEGLTYATKIAVLNANYIARRLDPHFPVLYKGHADLVAHECIIDLRSWKNKAGLEVEDVAKRLMDFGFHAPTMSWPVGGTMMIEPTESESKSELDRFCDAMMAIHQEMQAVESGKLDRQNNPLKNAPHTAQTIISDKWDRPYSRESAAYPAAWTREHKFWPAVGRIDNVYGDRHLVCSCLPMSDYAKD